MTEDFGIVVSIDGSKAIREGVDPVDRALARAEATAKELGQAAADAMRVVEESAKRTAKAVDTSAREQAQAARTTAAAQRTAVREQEEYAKAVTIAAERRAKERAQIEAAAAQKSAAAAKAAADQQRQAQAALASAYRSIAGPAAEYNRKLAEAIQLERRGAISAQQRANYVRGLQREMRQFSASQQGGFRGAVSSFASSQIGQFAAPAAIAGTALAVGREVIALSDSYTTLTNRLRAVTSSESEALSVRAKLLAISNETRVATDATATVYQRMAAAGNVLGKSQSELLAFTASLNKAVKISGATAAEAQAGMIQLAQGLGAGALRGDELRSVLEQLPTVADIIAKQLGVTRGQLRSMGEQGKITAEVVFEAFKNARSELDQRFAKSVVTVADLMQVLRNRVEAAVGQLVEQSGVIPAIADAFDALGPVIENSAAGLGVFVKMMAELATTSARTLDVLGKFSGIDAIFGEGKTKQLVIDTLTPFSGFRNADSLLNGSERLLDAYDAARTNAEQAAEKKRDFDKFLRDQFLASKEGDDFTRNIRRGYSSLVGLREKIFELADGKDNGPSKTGGAGAALRKRAEAARDFAEALSEAQDSAGGIFDRWAEKLEPATAAVDGWRAALDAAAKVEAETLAQKLERQRQVFDDVYGAGIAYQQMLEAARAEMDRGALSLDQYNKYVEDLRIKTYGGATLLEQMREEMAAASETTSMFADVLGAQLGGALNTALSAFVDFATGADVSIREMTRNLARDLALAMAKLLAFQALKAAVGGSFAPGGIASGIAGALGFSVGNNATGGSYTVPGGGGVDSVPFYGRATPGERITITRPGSSSPTQASAPGPISIAPIIVRNEQEAMLAYLRTPAGTRAVISIAGENPAAFRAAIGVR